MQRAIGIFALHGVFCLFISSIGLAKEQPKKKHKGLAHLYTSCYQGSRLNTFSYGLYESPLVTEDAVQSSDYFPVYPSTVWHYIDNGSIKEMIKLLPKLVKVRGIMTSVFKYKGGYREYYTRDSKLIYWVQ